MATVRVIHSLGDLDDDLSSIAARVKPEMRDVVDDARRETERLAKQFAREKSGIHGKAYYKRISSEMTGPLEAEVGPTGTPKTEFVGAGFRHGVNTDLPRAADATGPEMAADVREKVSRWFW